MTHHDPQTAQMIATARAELAASLADMPRTEQVAAARRACDTCGGSLIAPAVPWGPQEHVMSLLGITGMGASEAGAVADWIKAAQRSAQGVAA